MFEELRAVSVDVLIWAITGFTIWLSIKLQLVAIWDFSKLLVGSLVWAEFLRGLTQRDTLNRMRIILGIILIGFLVLCIWIPGCLRNKVRSNLELVGSEKTHLAGTGRLKWGSLSYWNPGTIFCHSTLNFFWHLSNIIHLISRCLFIPGILLVIISIGIFPLPVLSQGRHFEKREKYSTAL